MSEWNYTKCAKPFSSVEEAREYMISRGFEGQILARDNGGYTAGSAPLFALSPFVSPITSQTMRSSFLL